MPKCTAPVKGHHSAAARAGCPACGAHTRSIHTHSPTYAPAARASRGTAPAGARGNRPSTAAACSALQTGSAAGADFIVWILLAHIVRDHFWLMLLGAIAIGLPAGRARRTLDLSTFSMDQRRHCPLPASTRRIHAALPRPQPGDDHEIRRRGRRGRSHRRHQRAHPHNCLYWAFLTRRCTASSNSGKNSVQSGIWTRSPAVPRCKSCASSRFWGSSSCQPIAWPNCED